MAKFEEAVDAAERWAKARHVDHNIYGIKCFVATKYISFAKAHMSLQNMRSLYHTLTDKNNKMTRWLWEIYAGYSRHSLDGLSAKTFRQVLRVYEWHVFGHELVDMLDDDSNRIAKLNDDILDLEVYMGMDIHPHKELAKQWQALPFPYKVAMQRRADNPVYEHRGYKPIRDTEYDLTLTKLETYIEMHSLMSVGYELEADLGKAISIWNELNKDKE